MRRCVCRQQLCKRQFSSEAVYALAVCFIILSLSDVEVVSLWDGPRQPATRSAQTCTIRSVLFLILMALWRDARHRAGRVEIATSLTDMHVSDCLVNREESHFLRINCKSSCTACPYALKTFMLEAFNVFLFSGT